MGEKGKEWKGREREGRRGEMNAERWRVKKRETNEGRGIKGKEESGGY